MRIVPGWVAIGTALLMVGYADLRPAEAQTANAALPVAQGVPTQDVLARGAYIVEELAQCGRCHSPVDKDGERDHARWLTGGPLDVQPAVRKDYWAPLAPRIAGTPPGTDAEFIRLMMTGISRTGKRPMRPMPQFHMTQSDAEAVLTYLKSLTSRQRPTQ